MKKKLFYRLFGIGKVPPDLMTQLQSEFIEVFDEGIPGSITYKNFRAPGKRDGWRRVWFIAAIALTGTRLVALQDSQFAINVPFTDDRFRLINFSLEKAETLVIAFDASLFHEDWSGQIEYRFRTPLAQSFLNYLNKVSSK